MKLLPVKKLFWDYNTLVFVWALLSGAPITSAQSPALHIPQPSTTSEYALLPKRVLPEITFWFIGGASDGMVELLRNNYYRFEARHPKADPNKWNPQYSWKRKWKNGDPEQGPAYWGSTTILAWTTDPYHTFRTLDRLSTIAAMTIHIFDEKRKWYIILIEAIAAWGIRTAGFHFTYTLLH